MKFLTRFLLPAVLAGLTLGFASVARAQDADKPNITILATGGTIAGAAASGIRASTDRIIRFMVRQF